MPSSVWEEPRRASSALISWAPSPHEAKRAECRSLSEEVSLSATRAHRASGHCKPVPLESTDCRIAGLSFFCELRLFRRVINDDHKLANLLPHLRTAEWIAIDTEADSLHAYPEKLCLLQISIAGQDELVDQLADISLDLLWPVLRNHELIMHGADYDLRLLRRTFQFIPHHVFDTMIAARLLGYQEFSLTHLVSAKLGVTLEKGPQKMDWARRPLTERMERYARNDTRYLRPVAARLYAELETTGRLGWLKESCARLIREASQPKQLDPELVWRIKGSDRLTPKGLAILREL